MNQPTTTIKMPEQPKFKSTLDGMQDLDLLSRVQAVVGESLNPGGNAKAMKRISKDVNNMAKLMAPPQFKIKTSELQTNDLALSDSLESGQTSEPDNLVNPPKPKERGVVRVGPLLVKRPFLEKMQGREKKDPKHNKHIDETDAVGELPSRKAQQLTVDPGTRAESDARHADAADKMASLVYAKPCLDSFESPGQLKTAAVLVSFVAGIIKHAESPMFDETKPALMAAFLRGLYDSGVSKVAHFKFLDRPLRKAYLAKV